MIINVREIIKTLSDEDISKIDNELLIKKPEILSNNLWGVYCGEKFTSKEVIDAVFEFNLRLSNTNDLRLPRIGEIDTKGQNFWFEEDPESKEIKNLFLVMNKFDN